MHAFIPAACCVDIIIMMMDPIGLFTVIHFNDKEQAKPLLIYLCNQYVQVQEVISSKALLSCGSSGRCFSIQSTPCQGYGLSICI
jgi:hypothetical protein